MPASLCEVLIIAKRTIVGNYSSIGYFLFVFKDVLRDCSLQVRSGDTFCQAR